MLFAQRGVDGVTVQEIVNAAGQRNNAALHYHFGSKEELIRQMVVDGAAVLDGRRREMLDEMKARGGPATIRDVMGFAIQAPACFALWLGAPGAIVRKMALT